MSETMDRCLTGIVSCGKLVHHTPFAVFLSLCFSYWNAVLAQEPSRIPASPSPHLANSALQKSILLTEVLESLQARHGLRYTLAAGLTRDRVRLNSAAISRVSDIATLLAGYNWVGIHDARGKLTAVKVTGRNGDGTKPAEPSGKHLPLLSYRKPPPQLPRRYRSLPPGSVYPVDIPANQLRNMVVGERVALNLPGAEYTLHHDHAWPHENGDRTWVAKLETTDNDLLRSLITLGDGTDLDGQIRTPAGSYLLEADDTGAWLIDLAASGLRRGDFDAGGVSPMGSALKPQAGVSQKDSGPVGRAVGVPDFAAGASATSASTEIDVLLLYGRNMTGPGIRTRLNHLMALANQALLDSQAPVRLRLAGIEPSLNGDSGNNRHTLYRLTANQGAFRNTGSLRKQYRADLVLLVRNFKAKTHGQSCGEAWVNGGSGSPLSAELAYGVVNQGRDGGYYCSGLTLAHEIGHLLGAAHDRQHSQVEGHFSYARGYGVAGKFGDIMSYFHPETGLFANPGLIQCAGQPCGIAMGKPGEADVVSTFGKTAKTVASFMSGDQE